MKIYGFVIRNFRNLGLCEGDKSQEAFLRLSKFEGEFGGLTILIGESNSGKSNLLKAMEKFGNSHLSLNGTKLEDTHVLSQDDIPESPSKLTSIALAYQEPAYYLHYRKDIAYKSGAAKEEEAKEAFNLDEHLAKLQDDFDSYEVYIYPKGNKKPSDSVKLLLKNTSGGGRFMRCTIEPLKSINDYPAEKLKTGDSTELHCPFIVGYEALDVKQNFVDYINDTSQPILSSAFKENRFAICLDKNQELQQKYFVGNAIMQGGAIVSLSNYRAQEITDTKREQLRVPHIVFYDETHFDDTDLSTTPDKLKESKLFKGGITKKLIQINQDFSILYGEESYRFELNVDIDKFALEIRRGEQLLSLEEQGSGFRKLFNFVFSLAQQIDSLQKGDIVLIDDVEELLSPPIQKRLRKYLKELAQKRGILFIVSTHSPFMIDRNCLDEIRLLKAKDNGLGTEIVDFAGLDETSRKNALAEIVGMDCCNAPKPANGNGIEA